MVSLDGFIEDRNKELDWHNWNDEMDAYIAGFFDGIDTILLGRVTYELMAAYWPTPSSAAENKFITSKMNNLPKVVFSKTLSSLAWQNSSLVKENITQEIRELKNEPGKDMVLFGGAEIASVLMRAGLIDEYRIIVNPVVLGSGTPLFKNITEKIDLKLRETKVFSSGNVMLRYRYNSDNMPVA